MKFRFIIVILLSIFYSDIAIAQKAQVIFVAGSVEAREVGSNEYTKINQLGQEVGTSYIIRTGATGMTELKMPNGAKIRLYPRTTMQLTEFDSDVTNATLRTGGSFIIIPKEKSSEKVNILTDTMMGKRRAATNSWGNIFRMMYDPKTNTSEMAALVGTTQAKTIDDTKPVTIPQEQGILVKSEDDLSGSNRKPFSWNELFYELDTECENYFKRLHFHSEPAYYKDYKFNKDGTFSFIQEIAESDVKSKSTDFVVVSNEQKGMKKRHIVAEKYKSSGDLEYRMYYLWDSQGLFLRSIEIVKANYKPTHKLYFLNENDKDRLKSITKYNSETGDKNDSDVVYEKDADGNDVLPSGIVDGKGHIL